jgi:hypothetical protein
MAAKVSFLNRVLSGYGPETSEARARLRTVVEHIVDSMWPGESKQASTTQPDQRAGDAVYAAIENLAPQDERQRSLKTQAANLLIDLGQLRSLLLAQSIPSISKPLLVVVVSWLVVIFLSFSLLAPPNATATVALMVSALSVAGAILLILELDRPFGGIIQIPSEPMRIVLKQLAN